jgi:peptide/nickel transport system permease protein
MPGSYVAYIKSQLAAQGATTDIQQLNKMATAYAGYDVNAPLHEQYISYMQTLFLELDLGKSLTYNEPVTSILAEALPWTIFVMGVALVVNFLLAIILGTMMAYRHGSNFDYSMSVGILSVASIPYYIAALLLLFVLGYEFELFPTGGRLPNDVDVSLTLGFVIGALHHAILPIISLVITQLGRALGMRANSVSVLGEDFVEVARLRGLSERRITLNYVGHNAVLPLYTGLLISIGAVFGGSVILETIFRYWGAGYYIYQGVVRRDYILMMGGFLVVTIAVVIGVYIADMTYGLIDPRAGEQEGFR